MHNFCPKRILKFALVRALQVFQCNRCENEAKIGNPVLLNPTFPNSTIKYKKFGRTKFHLQLKFQSQKEMTFIF